MKQLIFIILFSLISMNSIGQTKSLYDFKVEDIDGKEFDMSTLKGKKVLIVNVASKCGFTPQYKELEELYQQYKDQNFVIIGFPSDNFMNQEFDTNEEIKSFCTLKYGVTFPMMSKVDVKGDKKIPLYKWLTEKSENGKFNAGVKWNFQKFMIDENGQVVDHVSSLRSPKCKKIIKWIEENDSTSSEHE